MRKPVVHSRLLAITASLLFIFIPDTFADQEGPPPDYTASSPDGKHIFVMAGEHGLAAYQYPASGMYVNDGSREPLWTVEWHAFASIPNGGDYVVRHGKWANYSGRYDEEAISFLAKGVVLRAYSAEELVDFPWLLSHSVSHYTWGAGWCPSDSSDGVQIDRNGEHYKSRSVAFDGENQTVEIRTELGDRLTFDLRTGEWIRSWRPATITTVVLLVALLLTYLLFRKRTAAKFLHRSALRLSNVLVGLLFTLALLVGPVLIVHCFRIPIDCSGELLPLSYYAPLAFLTLPHYFLAPLESAPSIISDLPPTVYGFWILCPMVVTFFDRALVAAFRPRADGQVS